MSLPLSRLELNSDLSFRSTFSLQLSPKEKEPYLAAAKKEKEQHKIM